MTFQRNPPCLTGPKSSWCGNRMPLSGLVCDTSAHFFTEDSFVLYSDTFMSKTARLYQDTRAADPAGSSNLDMLSNELQDVTRNMTKNMDELLWRGDSLDSECCDPLDSRLILDTLYECRIYHNFPA